MFFTISHKLFEKYLSLEYQKSINKIEVCFLFIFIFETAIQALKFRLRIIDWNLLVYNSL